MDWKSKLPLIVTSGIAAVAVGVFGWRAHWDGLSFSIDPTKVLNILSPLILAAGFIERAVEVLVSPWRDAGAGSLQKALDLAQKATPPAPAAILGASDALSQYRGKTQQYAFAISFTLSMATSMVGIRTLFPLLGSTQYGSATQHGAFVVVDVVLSAALLSGGADGIHSVVNAFTAYFDSTAQKVGGA